MTETLNTNGEKSAKDTQDSELWGKEYQESVPLFNSSEKQSSDVSENSDDSQERIYNDSLNQIENGMASMNSSLFKMNHEHTVKYLENVIANSKVPATVARAQELLELQNEFAKNMGL